MFGHAVRLIRKEKGISQDALAQGLAINQSSVSKWERSGNLPEEHLEAVAGVLGVTVRELRAKAGALLKSNPVDSQERLQIWQDTLLLDNQLDPIAKAMLAAFPYFWNDAIKAVIVSPTKYVERAGWIDTYDINDAWQKVLASGYLEPVADEIFKLVFRKG